MIPGAATFLVILVFFSSWRLLRGPTVPDRLIAADTMGIFLAMVMLLTGVYYNARFMVDVVLVFTILQFVDMLVFAKYYEHGELFK